MDDQTPLREYLDVVIAERNEAQRQLHDIRMQLFHLVTYWRGSPSVSTKLLTELLEMCETKPRKATPES